LLRWEGTKNVASGETFWYGEDNAVLTHWEGSVPANREAIGGADSTSVSIDADNPKYIAAVDDTNENSLMLTTDTRNLAQGINQYDANGGTNTGVQDHMGLSNDTTSLILPHIDYWISDDEPSGTRAEILSQPPNATIVASAKEDDGEFHPSTWENKLRITLEENNGTFLERHPVNVSINTGKMDVDDECSDLAFIEEGKILPYKVWNNCDSLSFDEPDDFVARWPMDEGIGSFANDTSSNELDGTLNGDASWVSGRFKGGIELDGDGDFIEVDDSSKLNTDAFTVEAWINWDGESGAANTEPENILAKAEGTDEGYSLAIKEDLSGFKTILGNGTTYKKANATTTPPKDEWIFLTASYNTSHLKLYVDGVLKNTTAVDEYEKDSNELTFGAHPNVKTDPDFNFNGSIDEVKIYDHALTNEEIQEQSNFSTTITFLTNISALATENDVQVFGGSSTNLSEPATDSSDFAIPANTDQPTVTTSSIFSYQDAAQRFAAEGQEGIGDEIDFTIQGHCTTVTFDSRQFQLSEKVC